MKVSPNKKYLVAAYESCDCSDYEKTSLDICSFNASSGEINILHTLTKNSFYIGSYKPWAVEFSPDSKLLYVSNFNTMAGVGEMELYQYNMQYVEDSLQFKQSELFITRGPVNGLQLARDGKIYTTLSTEILIYDYLSVIHEPWKQGTDCNFQADAVYLDGRQTHTFLPNMLLDHLYRFEWEGQCA